MKKANVVKKNDDFSNIIKNGKCVKDSNLVMYCMDNKLDKNRFGISVGTKIGKAHIRNKFKRQIRNIIDNCKFSYPNSKDYIIIVRKNCLEKTYQDLELSYNKLLKKINS